MAMGEVMGIVRECKHLGEIGDIKSEVVSEDDDAVYKIVYTPRGVIGGAATMFCRLLTWWSHFFQ